MREKSMGSRLFSFTIQRYSLVHTLMQEDAEVW
jgi:hypothetical protein